MNPLAAPGSLRRLLTHGLVTVGLAAGMIAATATPADAASRVNACFKVETGGVYYHNVYTQPGLTTYLLYHDGRTWVPIAVSALDQNGCVGWQINGTLQNYYLYIYVYSTNGLGVVGATYYGGAQFIAPPGSATYFLGSSNIACDICPWN